MAFAAVRLHGHGFGNPFFFIAALAVFFGAIPFVNKAMKDTGTEYPGWIVIDEVCGVFMTFAFIDPGMLVETDGLFSIPLFLIGFGLFRFFDIVKPLGVRRMERLPAGIGVMADDILAGAYSLLLIAAWQVLQAHGLI